MQEEKSPVFMRALSMVAEVVCMILGIAIAGKFMGTPRGIPVLLILIVAEVALATGLYNSIRGMQKK